MRKKRGVGGCFAWKKKRRKGRAWEREREREREMRVLGFNGAFILLGLVGLSGIHPKWVKCA